MPNDFWPDDDPQGSIFTSFPDVSEEFGGGYCDDAQFLDLRYSEEPFSDPIRLQSTAAYRCQDEVQHAQQELAERAQAQLHSQAQQLARERCLREIQNNASDAMRGIDLFGIFANVAAGLLRVNLTEAIVGGLVAGPYVAVGVIVFDAVWVMVKIGSSDAIQSRGALRCFDQPRP